MTAPIDLDAISAEFLTQCGSCDAGLPMSCACTGRDYRPTMLALVREVERLREVVDAALLWRMSWGKGAGSRGASHELADVIDAYTDGVS